MQRSSALFSRAGRALDRVGLTVTQKVPIKDAYARHRTVMNVFDKRPLIAMGTWCAPNSNLIGKVMMFTHSSVWYGAILRGDKSRIEIGSFTNIQERVVINTVPELQSGFSPVVEIGSYVSVGHGSVLTSCVVESYVSIGQGCIIPEGCVVEMGSILAAGTVLLPDTLIPTSQLWAGNPAVFIRDVTPDEKLKIQKDAEKISTMARMHSDEFFNFGQSFLEAEEKALI